MQQKEQAMKIKAIILSDGGGLQRTLLLKKRCSALKGSKSIPEQVKQAMDICGRVPDVPNDYDFFLFQIKFQVKSPLRV